MTSVLVVDDDPIILDVVEMVLRGRGLDVDTQTSGPDAVRAAHDQHPDCAVVDVTFDESAVFADELHEETASVSPRTTAKDRARTARPYAILEPA